MTCKINKILIHKKSELKNINLYISNYKLHLLLIAIYYFQLFFFTMVEMAFPEGTLKKDERIVSGLTTLLFYSVLSYFVVRIKDIFIKNWIRSIQYNPSMRNYTFWVCRIIIEWFKAIIVIVCLREQGMKYHPRALTTGLTFTYYAFTEKIFVDMICSLVTYFGFEFLDSLEHLIIPIVLNLYTLSASAGVILKMLFTTDAKYAILASYFVLYLRFKDVLYNYVKVLEVEKQTYASFRIASDKDIQEWDDICAVCLNRMSRAKITPCNHLFHPNCLKQCLKSSFQCPLCKHEFVKE